MADVIIITPQPIIATATVFQDIRTAIDVSMYDTLDVHVGALSVTGSSGTAVITLGAVC